MGTGVNESLALLDHLKFVALFFFLMQLVEGKIQRQTDDNDRDRETEGRAPDLKMHV